MRTRHCIITMMFATLPFCKVLADDIRYLVVNAKDGTTTSFALTDEPIISCKAGKLEIVSKVTTFSLSLADVWNYAFSETLTGIAEVDKDRNLVMENGHIIIKGLPSGSTVSAYLQDGRQAKTFIADEKGTAVVDLSGLPKGIVILHSNKTNIKIINRE